MGKVRDEQDARVKDLREYARKCFSTHAIVEQSDRRWLIKRIKENGKPDSMFSAEIIITRRGVYVGGDIAPVIFAAALTVIGDSNADLTHYLAEKASAGMGSDALTWSGRKRAAGTRELDSRVVYAHAAVERLCVLLREEEKAAKSGEVVANV